MNLRTLIVLFIVGGILLLFFVTPMLPFVVSGYGGLSSKLVGADYGFDPDKTSPWVEYEIADTYAVVKPVGLGYTAGIGATTLRCEIGQPQFRTTERTYFNEIEETLDNGDNLKRTWEVRIAYFDMGVTVRTAGGGDWAISDVTFTIEVSENDFNVFQDADEVKAYILEVVTKEPPEISDVTLVEVVPSAGGYSFDMDPVGVDPIPSWMSDSGYQDVLSTLETIRFSVNVVRASPYRIPVLVRAEQQATWYLEIRSLVFGFWEVLSPYDDWVPGEVWEGFFPWLDDLFLGLQMIIGGIFGLIVTVAIVKFPIPPFGKVVILGIVWISVFVLFGGAALVGI